MPRRAGRGPARRHGNRPRRPGARAGWSPWNAPCARRSAYASGRAGRGPDSGGFGGEQGLHVLAGDPAVPSRAGDRCRRPARARRSAGAPPGIAVARPESLPRHRVERDRTALRPTHCRPARRRSAARRRGGFPRRRRSLRVGFPPGPSPPLPPGFRTARRRPGPAPRVSTLSVETSNRDFVRLDRVARRLVPGRPPFPRSRSRRAGA